MLTVTDGTNTGTHDGTTWTSDDASFALWLNTLPAGADVRDYGLTVGDAAVESERPVSAPEHESE